MRYVMSDFMEFLVSCNPGDAVHLHPGEPPLAEVQMARDKNVEGRSVLHRLEGPPLERGETEELLHGVASEDEISEFKAEGTVCINIHLRNAWLFHVLGFRETDHVRLELRRLR